MASDRSVSSLPLPVCEVWISGQEAEDNQVEEELKIKFLSSYFWSLKILHFMVVGGTLSFREKTAAFLSPSLEVGRRCVTFFLSWGLRKITLSSLFFIITCLLNESLPDWKKFINACNWDVKQHGTLWLMGTWMCKITWPYQVLSEQLSLETQVLLPARPRRKPCSWCHWNTGTRTRGPRLQQWPCLCVASARAIHWTLWLSVYSFIRRWQ